MAGISVTSKGQVTIPKRVRQALGITPGSKVEFDLDKGGAIVVRAVPQGPARHEEGRLYRHERGRQRRRT